MTLHQIAWMKEGREKKNHDAHHIKGTNNEIKNHRKFQLFGQDKLRTKKISRVNARKTGGHIISTHRFLLFVWISIFIFSPLFVACVVCEWNGTDTFSMPNLSHWFQTMIVVPSIRFVCCFKLMLLFLFLLSLLSCYSKYVLYRVTCIVSLSIPMDEPFDLPIRTIFVQYNDISF